MYYHYGTMQLACLISCSFPQIHDSIMKRLAMSTLAQDMDSWIEKRDELSRKIDDLRKQKETIMKGKVSEFESYNVMLVYISQRNK